MDFSDFESEIPTGQSADPSFTFVRGSEDTSKRIERRLKKSQVNADRLSVMFQVSLMLV